MNDVRSLTLPKQTDRTRLRIRKPKRPSGWTVFWACYCVMVTYLAVVSVLDGSLSGVLINVIWLVLGWRQLVNRSRCMRWRTWWTGMVPNLILVGLLALGVIS